MIIRLFWTTRPRSPTPGYIWVEKDVLPLIGKEKRDLKAEKLIKSADTLRMSLNHLEVQDLLPGKWTGMLTEFSQSCW